MKSLITAAILSLSTLHAQHNQGHLSIKLEMQETIKKGNAYLRSKQHKDGYWGEPTLPAFTAYALRAQLSDPSLDLKKPLPANLGKGLDWLAAQQKKDGGIYSTGLATYNTSSAIMALYIADPVKYREAIVKARGFLIGQQTDWGVKNESDDSFDGGIGYGGSYEHSDLSNTHLALEALYHTRPLATDTGEKKVTELDWGAALEFVSRCQNLQATNNTENAGNDGGFVYFPGNSKAGEELDENGKTALRSYGSMSYAGLLSLVYADLDAEDPRVKAVIEWLSNNYTLKENPGLDQQGLYYYYHVMAKTLAAANIPALETKAGKEVDWRGELSTQVINAQREDGSWINKTARWMENDPILVSSYAVMTLEQIHATLQ